MKLAAPGSRGLFKKEPTNRIAQAAAATGSKPSVSRIKSLSLAASPIQPDHAPGSALFSSAFTMSAAVWFTPAKSAPDSLAKVSPNCVID